MSNHGSELQTWIEQQVSLNKLYVHDFKNPISALSANLSYLEAILTDVDEDVRGALSDSTVAMKMLLHMIDNLLTISRLEVRELIEPVIVPLDKFVSDALKKCRSLFATMEPVLLLEGEVPTTMCSWPLVYANLAVENMILSSLHNTPVSGQVKVRVVADNNDNIQFILTDNGAPVSPEYISQSFDREFQISAKTLSGARYGRALAMYAIKLASAYMGGSVRIVAKSEEEQQFVLTLPADAIPPIND